MKYTIHYSCGHVGEVNLIGPSRLRQNRIDHLERGKCFECYKSQSTAVAREQAQELELPVLVGTEKQVAWAETLRLQKLHEIEDCVEKLEDSPNYRLLLLVVEHISNETSAKQWIEWRYDTPKYLLAKVHKAMLAVPTDEQKQAELEAHKKADAVKRAALVEATLRPETAVCEQPAEITCSGTTISVILPERRDDFREIVRSLDYTWENGCWQRRIGKFAGALEDRFVELGHVLLAHGFLVRVFDEGLRARIVAGEFEPEQTRWITKMVKGDYAGWLMIQWGRNEDYYDAARKIKNSRYSRPCVVVPAAQFQQVLDFAQRYAFRLSDAAQEAVRLAQEDKENMLLVRKESVALPTKALPVDTVPPILAVPETVAVADDLRDED